MGTTLVSGQVYDGGGDTYVPSEHNQQRPQGHLPHKPLKPLLRIARCIRQGLVRDAQQVLAAHHRRRDLSWRVLDRSPHLLRDLAAKRIFAF